MIGTAKKPFDEILAALKGFQKIGMVGCDGCAKVCLTGGIDQVAALAQQLKAQGKEIVFEASPERTCNMAKAKPILDPLKDKIQASDALLVLGCGGAVQVARQATEESGAHHAGEDRARLCGPHGHTVPGTVAMEQCQECGKCILNETGGICPVTKCAKSLLNGPCGGSENGKCEVDRTGTAPGS